MMKRLMMFACSLALTGACSGTSATQGPNQLTSTGKPVATAETPATTQPVATGTESGAVPASAPATSATNQVKKIFGGGPEYREVTLPAGTVLPVGLETAIGSDTSRVEQAVSGRLRRGVMLHGVEVLPAGTNLTGHVTAVNRPGKVKGRGRIALRFTQLDTPGAGTTRISTGTISRLAPATKKKDAVKVLAPAAAGAIIGRIAGGKSGAGKGAVIGGGAGAGYVLATRGEEVRLGRGANLAVRLTAPLTLRVPVTR